MDDGYHTDPRRWPQATRQRLRRTHSTIATSRFSCSACSGSACRPRLSRRRIYFDVPTTRKLCERIAPYVPPSMRYKLDPEVAAALPFAPDNYAPGPPRVMYDQVEIEDVTHEARSDRTFFCIDVEETHNFVTTGGVVHNCRPPGNRDPQQDEIEACEPHLFRQIELIEPKVDRDARQLRDEAPLRPAARDHARARPGAGAHDRRSQRASLPALPPGRRALHARDAEGARSGLRSAAGAHGKTAPSPLPSPRQSSSRSRRRRRPSSSASSEPHLRLTSAVTSRRRSCA